MSANRHTFNRLFVHWYAKPVSSETLEVLAQSAKTRLYKRSQYGHASFCGIMQQTIADWWLDTGNSTCLTRGRLYAISKRKMALYHLIVGQLLISSKLRTAMDYLDTGLRYADGLINPVDYFTLYNRHEELRYLRLSATSQGPHDLPELLAESRVIRKLTQNYRSVIPNK